MNINNSKEMEWLVRVISADSIRRRAYINGHITIDEATNLTAMIFSDDQENLTVAEAILQSRIEPK